MGEDLHATSKPLDLEDKTQLPAEFSLKDEQQFPVPPAGLSERGAAMAGIAPAHTLTDEESSIDTYAYDAFSAMRGIGTDEFRLSQVLWLSDFDELRARFDRDFGLRRGQHLPESLIAELDEDEIRRVTAAIGDENTRDAILLEFAVSGIGTSDVLLWSTAEKVFREGRWSEVSERHGEIFDKSLLHNILSDLDDHLNMNNIRRAANYLPGVDLKMDPANPTDEERFKQLLIQAAKEERALEPKEAQRRLCDAVGLIFDDEDIIMSTLAQTDTEALEETFSKNVESESLSSLLLDNLSLKELWQATDQFTDPVFADALLFRKAFEGWGYNTNMLWTAVYRSGHRGAYEAVAEKYKGVFDEDLTERIGEALEPIERQHFSEVTGKSFDDTKE